MWVVGFVASFVSAFWAVRGLLRYISTHDFSLLPGIASLSASSSW
jgi:undecaprenyl pyrophosphate phosphatase UppP